MIDTNLSQFLHSWYQMRPGVRKLSYLKPLKERYPYTGYAYRVVEGELPYVKPPVSWSKTLPAIRKYIKLSTVEDDWRGILIYAKLSSALDLSAIAQEVLAQDKKHLDAHEIKLVQEVVSLTPATGIQIIGHIMGNKLHINRGWTEK